jgi:hypothetical protein
MDNEVGIRITGDDDSKPAFDSAAGGARKFKVEAKDAGGAAKLLGTDLAAAAREGEKDAADNLRAATAAGHLDRQIKDATDSLRKLRIEEALADRGSGDFTEKVKAQERALADLQRARKTIGQVKAKDMLPSPAELRQEGVKAGGLLGQGTLVGFGSAAKSLGPVASSFAIAIALQVAAVAGPLITASIGGAVLAGAGLGVAGLGAVLVKENPRVKQAAGQLGASVKDAFTEQASGMVKPVVDSLGVLERKGVEIAPIFGRMFATAGPSLTTFAKGLAGLVDEMLPGLEKAVNASGPAIDRIASELPGFGDAISDMLGSIADAAPGAAEGIGDLIDVMGFFVDTAGFVIESGSNTYRIFKDLTRLDFGDIRDTITGTKQVMRELGADTEETGTQASRAAANIEGFNEAVRDQRRALLGVEGSLLSYEEAIDAATAAGKANNDGIDAGNEKGRANRAVLDQLAGSTLAYAESIIKTTGDQDEATRVTERGRAAFIKSAIAMGATKAAATALATALFGIPKKVTPEVALKGDRDAQTKIGRVKTELNRIDGIVASPLVNIRFNGVSRLNKVERQLAGFDHGGLTGAGGWDGASAASGGLRGNMTLVGESGPELVELPPSSRVTPAAQTRDTLSGRSNGPMQLIISVPPGADRDVVTTLVRALRYEVRFSGKTTEAFFKDVA